MVEAAEELRRRLPFDVLTQDDLPKPALIARFTADETSCLFATAGLFQGIDVPGPTLSLVTIDRLPFPRPDEPLLKARRQELGPEAFRGIDLPRAATLLAQAGGRLIRTPPTGACSPCSTLASPGPATAGTSCGHYRRCGAPVTARRPRPSCARSRAERARAGEPSSDAQAPGTCRR